jgi:hypothetical protein
MIEGFRSFVDATGGRNFNAEKNVRVQSEQLARSTTVYRTEFVRKLPYSMSRANQ